MPRAVKSKFPAGYAAAISAVAVIALFLSSSPAKSASQVNSLSASAFALSASIPGILSVPSLPNPPVAAPPCPTDSADSFEGTGVDASPLLFIPTLSARVDCPALPAPLPFALPVAQSDVANVTLLAGVAGATDALSISGVHAECSVTEAGPSADTTISTLRVLGLVPPGIDLANLPANTVLDIPLSALSIPPLLVLPDVHVVLNEQSTAGGVLSVNGVHITTVGVLDLPLLAPIGPIDVVIAHAQCAQSISVITTSSTTTSTTTPGATTSSTTTSTTTPGATTSSTTTSTTTPGATTSSTTSTTLFRPNNDVLPGLPPGGGPAPTVVVPFVPQTVVVPTGVLARTGSDMFGLAVLALAALVIGSLIRRAGHHLAPEPSAGSSLSTSPARRLVSRLRDGASRRSWRR